MLSTRLIIDGPNFPCFSCDKVLFKKQVKILKLKEIKKLFEKIKNPFLNNKVGINEGMIKIIFVTIVIRKSLQKSKSTYHSQVKWLRIRASTRRTKTYRFRTTTHSFGASFPES